MKRVYSCCRDEEDGKEHDPCSSFPFSWDTFSEKIVRKEK